MLSSLVLVVFTLVIFLITAIAGLYPFRKTLVSSTAHFKGDSLATGVFLGAALLHMLPEANVKFHDLGYAYPWAYCILGVTFLGFLWFEHLGKAIYHHDNKANKAFTLVAWVMLCVHAFLLGTALGLNHEPSIATMIFLAIIAHKWAESFAISSLLNNFIKNRTFCIVLFLIFAIMTPAGIGTGFILGQFSGLSPVFLPIVIATSAGTFLYLGTLHGLEQCVLVEKCCHLAEFTYVVIGFIIMALVAGWL